MTRTHRVREKEVAMKKDYMEPEFEKLIIVTKLMSDVVLSDGEYDTHIGNDDDENENIGG